LLLKLLICTAVVPLLSLSAQIVTTPSVPTIVSTESMSTVTQNPLVLERDGTYSAVIGGKSVWAFDDTAMNAYNINGNNFISNTLAWTTNFKASNGIYLHHDHRSNWSSN
jgi:hypothetical protein